MAKLFLSCSALMLLFSGLIFSQKKPDEENKTVAAKANLLIFNDANESVRGIPKSEIKLFENGVETAITSLSTFDDGYRVSIVVDNSGSVRTQLDDVVRIAKVLVANLRTSDEATIIRFVGRENIEIEQPWTNDQRQLNTAIDNLYVQAGQSAVVDALYLACQDSNKKRVKGDNKRHAVVLISDGEDRNSYYSEKELLKLVGDSDIQIFTIVLTKGLATNYWTLPQGGKTVGTVIKFINNLTAKSGGNSYILRLKSTEADLIEALKSLVMELRSQYLIEYTAANITKDSPPRKLTVQVADGPKGERRKAIIRESIIVVANK